ncbi:hypothetical protein [Burkholderia pyrrocinia]|nr:hypothetical protein [Burkholderia pyrrocinia]
MKMQLKSVFALSALAFAVAAHAEVVKIGVAGPLCWAQSNNEPLRAK